MIQHFHDLSNHCSRLTTELYSTSFSTAIRLLHKDFRKPIYNIYGMVRFADEIVDSFHGYNKEELLAEFKAETYMALDRGISLNPILNSFQKTANEYGIDRELIKAFFESMTADLNNTRYDLRGYKEYIYGSAEVVGLMCLCVFCEGDSNMYNRLQPYARSLGAAFQKVNFLRDIKADHNSLHRVYFPGMDFHNFTPGMKEQIEEEIAADFHHAFKGVLQLPWKARFGVYVAYKYYVSLFRKIRKMHPSQILEQRVRIPGIHKTLILVRASVKSQLNLI